MEVKEFKMKDRIVKYYSIYELRGEFQKYIKENNLQYHLDFHIIENTGENIFLKGTLQTAYSELKIKDIVSAILPVNEIFKELSEKTKPSNEFGKIQTRIEKKLYMILLGVSDPEEVEGEEEDIKSNLKIETEPATEKQMKVIIWELGNLNLKQSILDYMKKEFQKEKVETLTKSEASQVITYINNLKKNE